MEFEFDSNDNAQPQPPVASVEENKTSVLDDLAYTQYNLLGRPTEATLYVPPPISYTNTEDVIPKVEIEVILKDPLIYVTFSNVEEMPPSASELSSATGLTDKVKLPVLNNKTFGSLRHEMIVAAITGKWFESDKKLHTIKRLNDETDSKSPDIIKEYKEFWFVLEVKTTKRTANEKKYNDSLMIYSDKLRSRVENKPIIYCLLVVSPSVIMTNLDLELKMDLRKSFQAHFLIGEQCALIARSLGWTQEIDENKMAKISSFWSSVYSVGKEGLPEVATAPIVSKEMIRNWDNDKLDKKDYMKYVRWIYQRATEEIKTDEKDAVQVNFNKDYEIIESTEGMNPDEIRRKYISMKGMGVANSFLKDWNAAGKRIDEKAPIQTPFFVPQVSPGTESWNNPMTVIYETEDHPLIRLWKTAVSSADRQSENFVEDYKDNFLSAAIQNRLSKENKTKEEKKRMRQYHRIKVDFSPGDEFYFYEKGLRAKKMKGHPLLETQKGAKKEPFSMFTETKDIEEFIDKTIFKLLEDSGENWDLVMKEIKPVYKKARGVWNDGDKRLDLDTASLFAQKFYRTKLAGALSVFSMIMEELNLSLNQFCSSNEYVLKKLPKCEVWILIKPTTASKKIFYSVILPITNSGTEYVPVLSPFKKPAIKTNSFIYYDFVSLDRHRIGHLLSLSEKMMCFLGMWAQLHDVFPLSVLQNPSDHPEPVKHFAATMLFYMEDKPQTSSNIQNVRYGYMEAIRNSVLPVRPLKVLKKLDPRPKSRLLVWAYNKIIRMFHRYSIDPPKVTGLKQETLEDIKKNLDEDEALDLLNPKVNVSGDVFSGLVSWVTGNEIKSYEIALNLSYMGVLHNKDESDQLQGYFKIFSKIVREEIEMRNARTDFMGFNEPEDLDKLRDHEFSNRWVRMSAELTRQYLDKKFSFKYGERLAENIEAMAIRKTAEEFATFKASFKVNNVRTHSPDAVYNERWKVLEGIVEWLREEDASPYPFLKINKILDAVENRGGVRANLFKKLQIGGEREIFVLDLLSRLLINFTESTCRLICEDLPMEMLTKGDLKLIKSTSHFNRVASKRKTHHGTELTIIDSSDATTWCQRFVMPVFGAMLQPFFHTPHADAKTKEKLDSVYNLIMRTLNCVTKKRLELPKEMLKKFEEFPDRKGFDEGMNELKEQFLGSSPNHDLLEEERSIWLQNLSNFMQGILHYTSSLMHACHLYSLSVLNEKLMQLFKEANKMPEDVILTQTTKVSSDDSSVIRTLQTSNEPTIEMYRFLTLTSYAKKISYKLFTAKQSDEKSTDGVLSPIEEFNSFWLVSNTLMMPIIKFVYAAVQSSVIARMDDRQILQGDLRKQVVENGGPIALAAIIQEAQCRIHYCNLGALTHSLFDVYIDMLLEKPHPAVGFYVLEPESLCGFFGYDFAHFAAIKRLTSVSKMENFLLKREGAEMTEFGKPSVTLTLLIGQGKSYKVFLNRLKIPQDWQDIVNEDPCVLFRGPQSIEESLFWIYKKSKNPSASEAFSFQSMNKIHAASVYVLTHPSVIVKMKKYKDETDVRKFSLLSFIDSVDIKEFPPLDDETEELIFSNREVYESTMNLVDDAGRMRILKTKFKRPSQLVKLSVPKIQVHCSLDLSSLVKRKWCQMDVRGSDTEHRICWNYYQSIYTWLRDTPQLTLEVKNCPFRDVISLADFIRAQTPSFRHYSILGPIRRGLPFMATVDAIIKNCQFRGRKLEEKQRTKRTSKNKDLIDYLVTKLVLILSGPFENNDEKLKKITQLFRDSDQILPENKKDIELELGSLSQKDATLALFQRFVVSNNPITELFSIAKRGVYGMYTQRQHFQNNKYTGEGVYKATIDDNPLEIVMYDDKLVYINTRNILKLRRHSMELKKLVQEIGIKGITSSNIEAQMHYNFISGKIGTDSMEGKTVPVTLSNTLGGISYLENRFILDINTKNAIRIKQTGISRKEDITVMSFAPPTWKFTESSLSDQVVSLHGTMEEYWLANKTMTYIQLASRISTLREHIVISQQREKDSMRMGKSRVSMRQRNPNNNNEDPEEAKKRNPLYIRKEWMKSTLRSRAKFLNMVPLNDLFLAADEDVTFREMSEELLKEDWARDDLVDYEEDFNITADLLNKALIMDPMEDDDAFAPFFNDLFSFDLEFTNKMQDLFKREPRAYEHRTAPIESIHRLWDEFLKKLIETEKKANEILFSSNYVQVESAVGKLVGWLVDNDERPIKHDKTSDEVSFVSMKDF